MSAGAAIYPASAVELQRRRRAYTTLIISLLAGVALSSVDFLLFSPAAWLIGLAILAVCLVLSRLALKRSLRSYATLRLHLAGSQLERIRGESRESFPLADATALRIVRTSRRSLREITARFGSGRRLGMNGVEEFERFEQDLRSRLPANVVVTEAKEPIDYDHPLFYVVFGLVTGVAFALAVRAMATLSRGGMKWATLAIACYSAILGVFVLLTRPLSQRYGPKSRLGDFVLGLFALISGFLLAARSLLH